jgi:hypothetical protein
MWEVRETAIALVEKLLVTRVSSYAPLLWGRSAGLFLRIDINQCLSSFRGAYKLMHNKP